MRDNGNISKQIILIRHARPLVSRQGLFDAKAAAQFITDYDAADVEEFILAHESIPLQQVSKVYCSPLVRSQLTARAIFGNAVEVVVDPVFREFERRIFSLPLARLPIKLWLLSARILWFLGLNSKGIETFTQARARAREAAALLARDATQNSITILVAHGLLNRFVQRELKKLGWRQAVKGGSGFLAVQVLRKS